MGKAFVSIGGKSIPLGSYDDKKLITPQTEILKGTTVWELARGILLIIKHVKKLVKDAKILYRNDSNDRAISLLILAMEELAKIEFIGVEIAMFGIYPIKYRTKVFKDKFVSHFEKQMAGVDYLEQKTLGLKSEYRILFNRELSNYKQYEYTKQAGFYVDYFGGKFISSKNNKKKLLNLVNNPNNFIKKIEKYLHLQEHVFGKNQDKCIRTLSSFRMLFILKPSKKSVNKH